MDIFGCRWCGDEKVDEVDKYALQDYGFDYLTNNDLEIGPIFTKLY